MILFSKIIKYLLCLILIIFLFERCNKSTKKEKDDDKKLVQVAVENTDPDCVEFVALWSAGEIAEQIGKEKKWVFLNYTVDLWNLPPTDGEGSSVGKLRASSYARIIEKSGDDYKVESPVDKVHGWLSGKHVKTISKKNPRTKKLCE